MAQARSFGFPNRDVCESTMKQIAQELPVQADGKDTRLYFR
jgi:hypothetical protein